MPTYNFIDTINDEIIEVFMSISDREEFLKENPHMQPTLLSAPNVVSGVSTSSQNRVPDGFKEVLSKVAEAHRYSDIGDKYGRAGIKEAKTKEVVRKHVDRVTKRLQNSK